MGTYGFKAENEVQKMVIGESPFIQIVPVVFGLGSGVLYLLSARNSGDRSIGISDVPFRPGRLRVEKVDAVRVIHVIAVIVFGQEFPECHLAVTFEG